MKAEKPIRVYADTSVYGGAFEAEFAKPSQVFFERVRQRRFSLVTSALVEREIEPGPLHVVELFRELSPLVEVVPLSQEAEQLQAAHLDAGIVTKGYADDALHVAIASAAACAIIVSWNFRHIVHFKRIPLYNAVNQANGFQLIAIYTPVELMGYED